MNINQVIIDYLLTCEAIYQKPIYFNFAEAKDGICQYMTVTNTRTTEQPFVDGSVRMIYGLTIVCFLSVSPNPVVKVAGVDNENVSDIQDVQALIDWIEAQNEAQNFPNFNDDNYIVEQIRTTTSTPILSQIDATQSSPLGRYTFTIELTYIDKTKMIWED